MALSYPVAMATEQANPYYVSPPCEEYPTILDQVTSEQPTYYNWQYIAHDLRSIWAAPLGVNHLYQAWHSGNPSETGFAIDPDAQTFVSNLSSASPTLPFATLTYITPCFESSDHPNPTAYDDGPTWLAWVVNAIGNSQYWPNTAILVTWDDWGGWYDHWQPTSQWPYHPLPSPYSYLYGNTQDANEWGFRVPLIVISPWITSRGYVSSGPVSPPSSPSPWPYAARSQGAITKFIEDVFDLQSMSTDDSMNDDLADMFNFGQPGNGLPYQPIAISPNYHPPVCHTDD
jgi:hypothetical protein